jgi:hypothetical protein
MNRELNITELETLLNVIQFMIDNIMRGTKVDNTNTLYMNQKLQKLTKYRSKIMKLIEERLDEFFKED